MEEKESLSMNNKEFYKEIIKKLNLFLCFIFLLQGCNPFMIFRPDSEELVKKGWAKQPKHQADPEPIYCYNTLALKDCYAAPLDEQNRLAGYYGPKP